jgi:hypothetical protein
MAPACMAVGAKSAQLGRPWHAAGCLLLFPSGPSSCCLLLPGPFPFRSLLLLGFVLPTLYIWHTELRMRRAFLVARAPADGRRHIAAAAAGRGPSLFDYLMFAGPAGELALPAGLLVLPPCRGLPPWRFKCCILSSHYAGCPPCPTPHQSCNVCCPLSVAVACMYSFVVVPS